MKKFKKVLFLSVAAIMLLFTLASCKSNSIIGTYDNGKIEITQTEFIFYDSITNRYTTYYYRRSDNLIFLYYQYDYENNKDTAKVYNVYCILDDGDLINLHYYNATPIKKDR